LLARFQREGQAAARLNHRNIAAVYDLGEHREPQEYGDERRLPFLVLEYLRGRDLKTVLGEARPGGLPLQDVLDYGAQVGQGLAAAHAAGVVHRDVKPANLMLLADGTVKICDFGIARIQDATTDLTREGTQPGTLAYMAPEQINGGRIDHRADLYALGATLYHLLTGRPVFAAEGVPALLAMHLTAVPAPPSTYRPGIGADVDDLVTALLAKDPRQRPSTDSLIASLTAARRQTIAPRIRPHHPAGAQALARPTEASRKTAEPGARLSVGKVQAMLAEAERIARSITDRRHQARALAEIAVTATIVTGWT
jgi:serine/threonine protein kinase